MNVTQYLAEMRALGHRFYVVPGQEEKSRGIVQMFPEHPLSEKDHAHMLELEAWRHAHASKEELAKEILANECEA